ncbi:MAG: DNA-directed RNA polymerase subunit beta, partial [Candidatus Berkelbacteria bacterium]|nr:DNA-directed RNA polymerase subunit beta [Candidatus Berkelbacteria bacterium]
MQASRRKQFSRAKKSAPLPDLVELQKSSYNWFLGEGLRELFDEITPVEDFTGKKYELKFGKFFFEEPVISETEARENNLTYKTPLRVKIKLINKENGEVKEQEVFLGDFPMMTERGTFIINGVERVVVSQIVRSYGVIFIAIDQQMRRLFGSKIIPNRGAWLEIETNSKDVVTVKIDRKRKIPVSAFLKAFGYTEKQIIDLLQDVNTDPEHDYLKSTLEKDNTRTADEAVVEVYKKMRPGDLTNPENARAFLETTFFTLKRYDLSPVGRYKINKRLGIEVPNNLKNRVLRIEDFALIVKEVIRLNCDPKGKADDIDSLSCRRIRAVGELVQNKVRVGLLRMERIIKDRMSVIDAVTITPALLINARPVIAVLQEFFASSQLSQFMNQTNPLSELEHKRTISATGPGGLSRERAGFEVRDVHPTHYGRLCPIESPEGPNIGLVSYIACYARVNKYGFIETPYYVVDHSEKISKVSDKIVYLAADTEQRHNIMPTSGETNENHELTGHEYLVRRAGKPAWVEAKDVEYADVSAKQIVSITTALIPFLENTDAARAMMGSNMQRQAVSLVNSQSPIIGTGVEVEAAKDSGQVVIAQADGKVIEVDNQKIVVRETRARLREYTLEGFVRSNQATCMHQRPIVQEGDRIKKGEIIADSLATENGEIALGQNILVAFMSFAGANFEDAIIISEKLVRDDRYTSIHIEKYSVEVR